MISFLRLRSRRKTRHGVARAALLAIALPCLGACAPKGSGEEDTEIEQGSFAVGEEASQGSTDASLGDLAPPDPAEFEIFDGSIEASLRELHGRVLQAPRDVRLRRKYAAALDANQNDEAARTAWAQAIALDPADARSYHLLGRLQAEAGFTGEAVETFSTAVRLDPSYGPTRWRLGLALLDLGRAREARKAFEVARELDPNDPSGALGLARAALELDEPAQAQTLLEELLTRFPEDGAIPKLLARAKRRLGDEAGAAVFVDRPDAPSTAFVKDPWESELSRLRVGFKAELKRAQALLEQGQLPAALDILTTLREQDPDHIAVEGLMVRALVGLGRSNDALDLLRKSLARGNHPRTYVSLGAVHYIGDDFDAAVEYADQAIELQPALAGAHFLRARALIGLGRLEEGLESIENAFNRGEESVEALLLYGDVLAKLGAVDRAVAALAQATTKYPEDLQAWSMRCEIEIVTGRREAARASLDQVARHDPEQSVLPYLQRLFESKGGEAATQASGGEQR